MSPRLASLTPLAAALLLPALALAQPASPEAEAAMRARAQELRLGEQRVALARDVQAAESRLEAAGAALAAAHAAAEAAQAAQRARAAELAPFIPVMQRLAVWPAETVLASPAPPEEALRGLAILQGAAHRIVTRAEAFRAAETEATARAEAATREAAALRQAEAAMRGALTALDQALEQAARRRAQAVTAEAEAARRAAETAARARDLGGAVARLRRDTPPAEPVAAPAGRGALPVAGRVTRGFGAPTEAGPAQGLTLAAAPGARVTSPCPGRVAFAGPFRSYGLLLIVECGDGYHFVLAGLDKLDTAPGERVLAGEPVGQLPRIEGRSRATLYLELRRNAVPVDPRGWFAGSDVAG